ncbi:MAG TPA: NADH-quinone oxidoreductase subunit NuoN [Dongiaceae bacterium]|nr:NADH-quinone oxidoreductase subunit NuoN [Dongiaceae bacterium]
MNYGIVLPEIWMALGGMGMLLAGVFVGERSYRVVALLGLVIMAVAILLVVAPDDVRAAGWNGLFVRDAFSRFAKVVCLASAMAALIMTTPFAEREDMNRFELPVLMVFSVLGMMMMVSANNLIALYLGLELQSLALYVLAAFRRNSLRASEAGLKYFVLGALSSGMLLYGASLIYGFTGTLQFDRLATFLHAHGGVEIGLLMGLIFLLVGLAFKISAVPFHMWTPDVYEGAPTPITAFFSISPKVAAFALLGRVLIGPFGPLAAQWVQIVVFLSVASMLLGSIAAIGQTNIKRLMGYSAIGNIGYALIGLAAGSRAGVAGALIYLAIYVVMNIGVFGVILSMRRKDEMAESLDDLAGLARSHPWMAHSMLLFMFSLAGIPPLAGFFGKYFVFLAAIDAHLYGLAILGVLSSVISAFYYLRIVKIMYFDEPVSGYDRADRPVAVLTLASAALLLFFCLLPAPLVDNARAAAAALFPG